MADSKTIAIAVLAVAVLVAAGAGLALMSGNGQDGGDRPVETHEVSITDSTGSTVTLEAPVTKFCTVNTNAAKFFQILGVSDLIVGVDKSTKDYVGAYDDAENLGDYKNPSGDLIVKTGAKVVISQSSSRSLSAATEQALKDNYGITVLRLDCFGGTMMQDVEELLKLICSEKAEKAFDGYKQTYSGVVDRVLEKSSAAEGDPSFLFLFASMSSKNGTYYSETSELSALVERIHGHNALKDMGIKSSSSTSKPSPETILDYDSQGRLGLVFVRGTQGSTAEQDYGTFISTGGALDFKDLGVVKARDVFVLSTDIVSGPTDYIGYVCIAEAFGIDTGLDAAALLGEFEAAYGLGLDSGYLMERFPAESRTDVLRWRAQDPEERDA